MCAIYAQQLHQDGRAWRKVGLPEPGSSQTVSDVFSEYPFFCNFCFYVVAYDAGGLSW